ncbi:PEP-CTERM domain protein [Sphingomonas sp. Leaf357]|uniref:PEPxxWA-CTERM sorting domain-containing protein n=1 Tax=Sphingomonas sp. Leaf357 TaxID=1736350 RepID=UPI0006F488C9|nr:PEPxxWA-CTERM sorting domain-containing protein [Sphingomonas sp. Leaf357]KQS04759.1 PEP-CTERM domain protein [Sphingomonas sp. Leaf357]
MTCLSIAARGATAAALLFAAAPSFAADFVYGSGSVALGTGGYTQNFNTLASSGTSSTLPTGWIVTETGTNSNGVYTAGTGSSTSGDVYSFGSTAADRALGTLRSGTLIPSFGAVFTNATGATITGLNIGYTGEQWRNGSASVDSLVFQYSLTSTNIADADNSTAWISLAALEFLSPSNAVVGALDGNAAANRTALSALLSGLTITNGQSFAFRWIDSDPTGADDGLAVDDFSLSAVTAASAVPETATWAMMIAGFGMIGSAMRRRSSARVSYAV